LKGDEFRSFESTVLDDARISVTSVFSGISELSALLEISLEDAFLRCGRTPSPGADRFWTWPGTCWPGAFPWNC
jgi:hypothetical protein